MLANKQHTRFYVSNLATTTAVTTGTVDDLTAGQIALVTLAGAVINTANSGSYDTLAKITAAYPGGVRLAVCEADGITRLSDVIIPSTITATRIKGYTSPSEKVSFIGSNGTTGAMDSSASTNYIIRLLLQSPLKFSGDYPLWKEGVYASLVSTSQAAIATGLLKSLNANFSREKADGEQFIKFDRVGTTTSIAAITGTTIIAKLTNGSKVVNGYTKTAEASVALTNDGALPATDGTILNIPSCNGRSFTFTTITSVSHTIYVGTKSLYLASAGDAAANGVALIAAINADTTGVGSLCVATGTNASVTITYKPTFYGLPPVVVKDTAGTPLTIAVTIASGDAVATKNLIVGTTTTETALTMDVPWEGATGYVFSGAVVATHIGIATLTSSAWGLKLTGVPRKYKLGAFPYQKADWTINLDGSFVTATVTDSVAWSKGSGFYQEVEELEWQLQQNEMMAGRNTIPPIVYKHNVSPLVRYDLTTIDFYSQNESSIITSNVRSLKRIILATNSEVIPGVTSARSVLTIATSPLALMTAIGGTTANTSL